MKSFMLMLLSFVLFGCGSQSPEAYVTSQDAGVSVVNLDTGKVTDQIDVQAEGPRGIGVTSDGRYIVTANKSNSTISVIDRKSHKLLNQIEVGKNPEFVRVYQDYVFVSTEPASSGKPPAENGHEEDDDDGDKEPAKIAVVDLRTGSKIREIEGGPETEGIEFSNDGKQVIVTNEADNTVTVHNFETGELLKKIDMTPYGNRPRGIKASPDGNNYVATLEHSNNFVVLDKDFNHIKTVPVGINPYGVAFNKSGSKLFVSVSKSKALEVYDTKNYEKENSIALSGNRCWHFTFTPDDKKIIMACGRSDELLVLDAETQSVEKSIPVKGIPWGIVTYPKSIGSLDDTRN